LAITTVFVARFSSVTEVTLCAFTPINSFSTWQGDP
jgi:hypothetical protein